MAETSGIIYKNVTPANPFEITAAMSIFAVSWCIKTGSTLSVASNETYIDSSGNQQPSDTAIFSDSDPPGTTSSRNQFSPLTGLTFTASGGTVILMMYK